MKIVIDARWDDEAAVWYAVARGEVGLATESGSLDGLRARILAVLPDLLDIKDTVALEIDLLVHGIAAPANPMAAE